MRSPLLTLTDSETGSTVLVHAQTIKNVYVHPKEGNSVVNTDTWIFRVKESPEDIHQLVKEVYRDITN